MPLQLMPNNGMQAREMLSHCHALLHNVPNGQRIHVLAEPRGDSYVDSMLTELSQVSRYGGYGFELIRIQEAEPTRLEIVSAHTLICIGYQKVSKTAELIANQFHLIILSDGCSPVNAPIGVEVFQSVPAATPAQYALDAWRTLCEVYRERRTAAGPWSALLGDEHVLRRTGLVGINLWWVETHPTRTTSCA